MNLDDVSFSNVYLYIADAVRWDSIPQSILEMGTANKMVTSSIHTPTSFASIVSGLHPPQHGCWDFSYSLNEDAFTIFDIEGYETRFADSGVERFNPDDSSKNVVANVIGEDAVPYNDLSNVKTPFIFVERGQGGHAPYGNYEGRSDRYFVDRGDSETSQYRQEYREGIQRDFEHFQSQIDRLEDRGLLEDTLIIYTSDHGELLGEGGCLAHNDPIHPKHVYVPFILSHPDIDNNWDYSLSRHVDILPTILGTIATEESDLPGFDLSGDATPNYAPTYYKREIATGLPFLSGKLDYEAVWDRRGGYVIPQNRRLNRTLIYFGKLAKSTKRKYMRSHIYDGLSFYLQNDKVYGVPSFDFDEAIKYLEETNNLSKIGATNYELSKEDKEHLRNLGYME